MAAIGFRRFWTSAQQFNKSSVLISLNMWEIANLSPGKVLMAYNVFRDSCQASALNILEYSHEVIHIFTMIIKDVYKRMYIRLFEISFHFRILSCFFEI